MQMQFIRAFSYTGVIRFCPSIRWKNDNGRPIAARHAAGLLDAVAFDSHRVAPRHSHPLILMKRITFLDAYDYVRQVLRNMTSFDNIRRDDDLRGKPRLGLDNQSLKNVRLAILARFSEVNPDKKKFSVPVVTACNTPEDLLKAIWAAIPDKHKLP